MMVHGIKMKDTLANKKNEKSRRLVIKECEYFSKLIFKRFKSQEYFTKTIMQNKTRPC